MSSGGTCGVCGEGDLGLCIPSTRSEARATGARRLGGGDFGCAAGYGCEVL